MAGTRSERSTLRARLGIVAAVFMVSMLLSVGLSALMVRAWSRSVSERNELRDAAEVVTRLQLAYSDQETGVHGYVLSRDPVFLDPYHQGVEAADTFIATLAELDPDITGFEAQLDRTRDAAERWREEFAMPAIEDPTAPSDEEAGLEAFQVVRTELDVLDGMVDAGIARVADRLDRVQASAIAVLIGSAVVAVGGTLLVLTMFRRWVIQPLSAISHGALRLSEDDAAPLPHFDARELENVTLAIETLQGSLARERDRALTAYRGLEQSAMLAVQVRSELASELGEMPPGWSADSLLVPAEGLVAGDCFDVGLLDAHRIYAVMIDVTGHGAAAALNALKAKGQVRAALRSRSSPGAAIEMLSRETQRDAEADLLTVFVAIVDLTTGRCTYASAGHPPALLRTGDAVHELEPTGPLVGAFSANWSTESVDVPAGATLLVHTDGVTEVLGAERERFGEERLRGLVVEHADPVELVAAVSASIESFREGPRSDDVTMLAIRRWHVGPDDTVRA